MTVKKSKKKQRENFEKKNLKHKNTTWMTAESLELTMSLTSSQEEMKKRWNWGKDSPQTEGRQGARTGASLWKQQRDQGGNRRVRMAWHPERPACETRFFYLFDIVSYLLVCAKVWTVRLQAYDCFSKQKSFYFTKKRKMYVGVWGTGSHPWTVGGPPALHPELS